MKKPVNQRTILILVIIFCVIIGAIQVFALMKGNNDPELAYIKNDPLFSWQPTEKNGEEKIDDMPARSTFETANVLTQSTRTVPVSSTDCSVLLNEMKSAATDRGWTISQVRVDEFSFSARKDTPGQTNYYGNTRHMTLSASCNTNSTLRLQFYY